MIKYIDPNEEFSGATRPLLTLGERIKREVSDAGFGATGSVETVAAKVDSLTNIIEAMADALSDSQQRAVGKALWFTEARGR